ncbi:MAG: hypothetical protein H6737_29760 [Alphaproteobacteria bacterium]|nr:hypothetical protein [Alphaproteobacteria bacterium]
MIPLLASLAWAQPVDAGLPAAPWPELRMVHHSELHVKKRVAAALPAGIEPQRCKVWVLVSKSGKPAAVQIEGCDPQVHAAVEAAAMRWRWKPMRVHGAKADVRTVLAMKVEG